MTEIIKLFFPRVRTPCGHGAQVIVEGREEQSDGGMTEIIKPIVTIKDISSLMNASGFVGLKVSTLLAAPF